MYSLTQGDLLKQLSHLETSRCVETIRVPSWEPLLWLKHGFSTRAGGVSRFDLPVSQNGESCGELNLGFTPYDRDENVIENRRRFFRDITDGEVTDEDVTGTEAKGPYLAGPSGYRLKTVRQLHSDATARISNSISGSSESGPQDADGMVTQEPGLLLGILTADCIPILVADPLRRVVAAFHAGWRGSVTRIVELGIEKMRQEFGSQPDHLVAAIGPGIRSCCYVVGEEVLSRFRSEFKYANSLISNCQNGPALSLDLIEANRRQLLDAGVQAEAIDVIGECTHCRPDRFFSHRHSNGRTGRMMAAIGVKAT